jgi:hypothetical protein
MVWLAMSWVGVTSGAQVPGTPTSLDQRLEAYRAGRFRPATDSWDWPFDPGSERAVRDIGRGDRADPVAAAFLLEYAEAAYRAGRSVAFDTFDHAHVIARRGPSGTAFDRAWHTAALALTEARWAGIDLGTVQSANYNPRDGHVYPGVPRRTK